jgi:histidinol dehydrogenase
MKLLAGEEAAQSVRSLAHRYASFDPAVEKTVAEIVGRVRTSGDSALLDYARRLDGLEQNAAMRVTDAEM